MYMLQKSIQWSTHNGWEIPTEFVFLALNENHKYKQLPQQKFHKILITNRYIKQPHTKNESVFATWFLHYSLKQPPGNTITWSPPKAELAFRVHSINEHCTQIQFRVIKYKNTFFCFCKSYEVAGKNYTILERY